MHIKTQYFFIYLFLITVIIVLFSNILIFFTDQNEKDQTFKPQINELGNMNDSYFGNRPAYKSKKNIVREIQLKDNIMNSINKISNPHIMQGYTCPENRSVQPKVNLIMAHATNWGVYSVNTYENASHNGIFIEIFSDGTFQNVRESSANCKVALLVEPPVISPQMYEAFKQTNFHKQFDVIFTFNTELLSIGFPFYRTLFGGCSVLSEEEKMLWKYNETYAFMNAESIMKQKGPGITEIFSHKRGLPGYELRHSIWNEMSDQIIGFGSGTGNWIPSKRVALEPYRFSIVIENNIDQGLYFSEKLIDCITMLTVPIYWSHGNQNLAQFFDFSGFILFSNISHLKNIIKTELATEEMQIMAYNNRKDAVLYNLKQALWFLDGATYKYPNYQLLDGNDGSLRDGMCCNII